MSWIVTPNLITVDTADNTATGWGNLGTAVTTALNTDTDVAVQGTGCAAWGLKNIGPYFLYYSSSTARNLRNQHLYIWFNTFAQKMMAAYHQRGLMVVVGNGTATIGAFAGWVVDGADTYPGGWQCYVIDCNSPPDWIGPQWLATTATQVGSIATASKFGMLFSASVAGARAGNNVFIDAIRYGSGLTIYSGSDENPANWKALYDTDNDVNNKYGIVSKEGGVYFLQGQITIGTASAANESTKFIDSNQIVEFQSKWVSESFYRLVITGSRTTCSFGSVIGTGKNSIGVQPIIIRGPVDFAKGWATGSINNNVTRSLRPDIDIGPEVQYLKLYSSRLADLKNINFGYSGSAMDGRMFEAIDNTFANTFPLVKNIAPTASLWLNNKMVSTTGSFITSSFFTRYHPTNFTTVSQSHAMLLIDTASIDGSELQVLNSYGFTSLPNPTTQEFNIYNVDLDSNVKYVTVYRNKKWNFINPSWITPTTNSIVFLESGSNEVNERYQYNTYTFDAQLVALSASKVYIYEGLRSGSTYLRGQTDGGGFFTVDIPTNKYLPSASTLTTPRLLISQSFGNFTNKIYNYGYVPYIAGITVNSQIDQNVTLITDGNITEPNQNIALANSTSIFLEYNSSSISPNRAIKYKSGSLAFTSGSSVTGSSSGARGLIQMVSGDTSEGLIMVRKGNAVPFTQNEVLTVFGIPYATASVRFSEGGFSGSYSWHIEASSNIMANVYDYMAAEMATFPLRGGLWEHVMNWGQGLHSQLLYVGTTGYYTPRNATLREGVWISNYGAGTVAYMTSDEGYLYVPPVQYTLTLTGLIAGSEVRIYITGSATGSMGQELAGIESCGTSFSYSYIYTGDVYVDIVVVNVNYEYYRVENVLVTNENSSIPIQQRIDRNYYNPPGP